MDRSSPPMPNVPDVLQQNCRLLRGCVTELTELFRVAGVPAVLLLQETRGETPIISGYLGYFQPTIEHRMPRGSSETRTEAQVVVFVPRDVPTCLHRHFRTLHQTQRNSGSWCNARTSECDFGVVLRSP
ncbi:hypothetical protein HPB48_012780 [Haemaphysalis longicornis]|uniref:Uncharacterized protein n=1 Tax=Haemaphysalis longicornis TaxID=44386 RepID=A0A9J6G1E7_HAELO|nr:hypothetical protein HPB48_012780 [Haemaphysalis longicornis]